MPKKLRNSIPREIWDTIILFFVLVLALEIPVRIAMEYPLTGILITVDLLISLMLAGDILLHLRSPVLFNKVFIKDPARIRRRYLKSWFIVDLIGAVPWDLLILVVIRDSQVIYPIVIWLRIIRMVKLARIINLIEIWHKRQIINPSILRLFFFFIGMLFIAHWIACGWVKIGGVSESLSPINTYIRSLYWTVTTLTTVGYGDITPSGVPQTLFTMVIMVLGVGGYGYLIGNISSLLANLDVIKAQQKKKMEEVNMFIKLRNIPHTHRDRIRTFFDYKFASKKAFNEAEIMDELPFSLKTDIALHLHKELMSKVPIFKGASDGLIRELVTRLKHVFATPGDFVIRYGDVANVMYFIARGEVEVLSKDRKSIIAILKEGQFFGEMSLLTSGKRTAYIRALKYCDLYTLDKQTFDNALEKYPRFRERINEIVNIRGAERKAGENKQDE